MKQLPKAKKLFIFICLFCSSFIFTSAQPKDFSRLEESVKAELNETNTPGAAVAIVSGDKIVFAKGFGTANVETNIAVTPEMLFRIGSMTKIFTAQALLALAEEGKLKLDEPIGNYVKGLSPKIAQITPHQLLTHTSGIRDEARPFGPHDETALLNFVRSLKEDYLFTEPGKIFSYSNLNYVLIGAVIEETSGKTFADAMNERLFKPLGMLRTTFRPTEAMTYPLVQGHNVRGNAKPVVVRPFTDNSTSWAAGFMFSNINDLARFAIAFMDNGMLDGKQILAVKNIEKARVSTAEVPGIGIKYGYGLRIEETRGIKIVSHGGAIPGFGSYIVMSPENRFAVVVLTNKSGGRLEKTIETAMEIMLPVKAKIETKPPPVLTMNESEMQIYTGVYRHSPRQILEIAVKDGKLYLKDEDELTPLQKVGNNRFLIIYPNSAPPEDLTIVLGMNGKAEYLHLNGRAFKRSE